MSTANPAAATAANREKLKSHMAQYSGSSYVQGWDELWNKGDFLPWDRGSPSPALADTLLNHAKVIGGPFLDGRRKRALVPGCGRGVDVLLLASFGYDVVGLEYAEKALAACEEYVNKHKGSYPVKDVKMGQGEMKFVQGDFYKDEWFSKVGWEGWDGKFDLIYDYTFFCAMHPSMRKDWAKRMTELLRASPQANLVCLEFPISKPAKSGGPPFSVPPKTYLEHLSHPGEEIAYDSEGNVKMNPLVESSPNAFERVGHWHPADTHQVGKDKDGNVEDYISVWRHR
ncbi:hypothetical protein A1O7_04153 [Cladophialophora yegresii CBS 114405]|uniref:Thiol methyltransferase n=1 Tax=Cladophialophora yegresii CBS 114405 TaxID=1182544 RepID=W9W4T5_9EURO|nr:uncharacterized protein A1O7_04153 [Cladophialophora yegresii CBS 114405]EXJ60005.1 hypothetical protein A1O7_04153 [Cladophialophora yegresii CBS 114405]